MKKRSFSWSGREVLTCPNIIASGPMPLRWTIACTLLSLALGQWPDCQARINALESRVRELELELTRTTTGHHYIGKNRPQPAGGKPTELVTTLGPDADDSLSLRSASGRDVDVARPHAGSSRQMKEYGDQLEQVSKVAARAAHFGFASWPRRPDSVAVHVYIYE